LAAFRNSDKFKAKLAKLPTIVGDAARSALEQGATDTVAAMKSAVPIRTGDLRDTIGWCYGPPPSGSKLVAGARSPAGGNDHKITVYAGSEKAFYARFVEFGTKAHPPGSYRDKLRKKRNAGKHGHPRTPAEPFFYPVWRMMRSRVRSLITRQTNLAIKTLAKGGDDN
jgi:HK97 gp10 family phage protein